MSTPTFFHRILTTWCFLSVLLLPAGAAAGELPEIVNTKVHSPTLISSGQPSERQFDPIAGGGVHVVINLAPKNLPKSLQNEEKLVKSSGMDYHFIPVNWENPDQADFDRFLQAMDAAAGKTVLAHCWVNARSSALSISTASCGKAQTKMRSTRSLRAYGITTRATSCGTHPNGEHS